MKSKLQIENVVGIEVNVKTEDIDKLVVYAIMFGFGYSKGFSDGFCKFIALGVLEKSTAELKEDIKNLDSNMWCKRRLLSKILYKIEEFQKSFKELEWELLLKKATALVKEDIYNYIPFCDKLDWDDLMVDTIREFRKMGILLYEVTINHKDDSVYYYLFDPNESDKLEIRDYVLQALAPSLDMWIDEYGYYVSDDLLKKVWSKRNGELKAIFWKAKNENLRERFWKELFFCCVCDRDLEED